jgi:hypothetical protein
MGRPKGCRGNSSAGQRKAQQGWTVKVLEKGSEKVQNGKQRSAASFFPTLVTSSSTLRPHNSVQNVCRMHLASCVPWISSMESTSKSRDQQLGSDHSVYHLLRSHHHSLKVQAEEQSELDKFLPLSFLAPVCASIGDQERGGMDLSGRQWSRDSDVTAFDYYDWSQGKKFNFLDILKSV